MIACLSPNGQNQMTRDFPPTRLLVATLRGISVLERETPNAPWAEQGLRLEGHHCSSIMIEPRRGGIFAGMHSGGLYFSADGGETWEPRSNGITIGHVFSLGYAHHGDAVVLYAGTEPASMFRSDDYGRIMDRATGRKGDQGAREVVVSEPAARGAREDDDCRSARSERDLCGSRAGRPFEDDRRRRELARSRRLLEADRLDVSRHSPDHHPPFELGRALHDDRDGALSQLRRGRKLDTDYRQRLSHRVSGPPFRSRRSTTTRCSWPVPGRTQALGKRPASPTGRSREASTGA